MAKPRRVTKTEAQRIHFKRRFLERHGITLNRHDIRHIAASLRDGKGKLISKQTNRVSIVAINFREEEYVIIYDRQRQTPVTVLPKDNPYQNKTAV